MTRYLVQAFVFWAVFSTAAMSQNVSPVCDSGISADAYIDFSAMPPAPDFPSGSPGESVPSAPFTATIPVLGVPGLTVQVTIPQLTAFGPGPVYSAGAGGLSLNGNLPASGEFVQLEFSRPVGGLSLIGTVGGRGSYFSLATNEASGEGAGNEPGPNFQSSVTNDVEPYYHFSTSLEAVGSMSEAIVYSGPGGYGAPYIANVRVQSQVSPATTMVPREGLEQWLMSDSALDSFAGSASSWPDQSGKGHDATQTSDANQPLQTGSDGKNCRGGFLFSQNRYFNFNLPIDGWEQMTIFMVAKAFVDPPGGSYASQASAIFWNENAQWGNTFVSPYQTTVPFRFGTKQVGNQPIYKRPAIIGQDFTITRAVHDGRTDSLYVDGLEVVVQENKLPVLAGTNGSAYIGRGLSNTYLNGEISEILIYNRVLSANEAASVESYLRNKFGTR
jgi:Concanavalin A-like lectin/glucanases superfamily